MTYARRKEIGTNRTAAIAIVAVVHVVLGYAIVSGLAYTMIQEATENLTTFDVEETPPPPPVEPPPEPEPVVESPPPPVVSPPPIVRTNVTPPIVRTVTQAPPPVVTTTAPPAPPAPPAPSPPPAPPPVQTVPPRSAVGDLQGLFRGADYPESALEREEQGSVTVRLTIGTNGRVTACNISSSSRSRILDNATCRILQTRAKFTPARDDRGNPTTDTITQRISWVLQG